MYFYVVPDFRWVNIASFLKNVVPTALLRRIRSVSHPRRFALCDVGGVSSVGYRPRDVHQFHRDVFKTTGRYPTSSYLEVISRPMAPAILAMGLLRVIIVKHE